MNLVDRIAKFYQYFPVRVIHVSAVYYATSAITSSLYGDPIYHISGFVSVAIGRLMDHASTIPMIKLINKLGAERLKKRYRESNPFIGKHPTMKQYIKRVVLQDLFLLGLSTAIPTAGYGYLSFMPFIYISNKNVTRKAKTLFYSGQSI